MMLVAHPASFNRRRRDAGAEGGETGMRALAIDREAGIENERSATIDLGTGSEHKYSKFGVDPAR
jgi:hypothetical protein